MLGIHASSDNKSGPWMKCVSGKPIRHKEGCAVGRFDEMECSFDKTRCKFMFRKKIPNASKWVSNIILQNP